MAVKLRLRRMGKKKQPIYKLVAADSRSPRDGKFIEVIGLYNPLTKPATVEINEDRAMYWLNVGAQPTLTVKNLLSKKGLLLKKDLERLKLSAEKAEVILSEWSKLQEAKLQRAENRKSARSKKKNQTENKAEAEGTSSGESN